VVSHKPFLKKTRRFVAGLWAEYFWIECWHVEHSCECIFRVLYKFLYEYCRVQPWHILPCSVHLSVSLSVTFVLCQNESPFWFFHTKPYGNMPTGTPEWGVECMWKIAIAPPAGPGRARPPNAFWWNSNPKFQISEYYQTARRRKCHIVMTFSRTLHQDCN